MRPPELTARTGQSRARGVTLMTITVALAVLLTPSTALAQGDVDTPQGYEFCGWKDFVDGGWTYDDPPPGAYLRLFARKMSCRTARRNYKRVRYQQTPPYRAKLKGFRCVTLDERHEYADVRCAKQRRPKVALRWQTGA